MILFSILLGHLLPTLNGWLLLGLIQNTTPVLFRAERVALGFLLGGTATMFLLFCIHIVFGLSLSFWPLFLIQILLSAILAGAMKMRSIPFVASREALGTEGQPPVAVRVAIAVLGAWTALKVILPAITFLFLTPTYFDDSVDNWNLRAKVFHHEQTLSLLLPGKGDVPAEVSSYPPTVPMMKAWLAMPGGWSDAAANSIHLAWFLCTLTLLYYGLRRYLPRTWSLFGVYAVTAMPLYLMHGTNTYADVFVSAHVFAAVGFLYHAIRSNTPAERNVLFAIGGCAAALLPFTKNEGLLLYLPPVLLILAIHLFLRLRDASMSVRDVLRIAACYAVPLILVLVPWLSYKYANGLTFGNAKAVSSLAFGWQQNVLSAIAVNTFFEGNWLLLFPVFVALLAWRRKKAFGSLLPVTAFFLMLYVGQLFIYLFTSISVEAILQTGYARGLIQLMPVIVFLSVLLLEDGYGDLRERDVLA